MDPHPLASLFKRSNYVEPVASDLSALDYLYEVLLEIRESGNLMKKFIKLFMIALWMKSIIGMISL